LFDFGVTAARFSGVGFASWVKLSGGFREVRAHDDRVMRVNAYGAFHVMQRALCDMQGLRAARSSTVGKWESPNKVV